MLGLNPMVTPQGGGGGCLRGEELSFFPTSKKKDLGI